MKKKEKGKLNNLNESKKTKMELKKAARQENFKVERENEKEIEEVKEKIKQRNRKKEKEKKKDVPSESDAAAWKR